MTLREDKAAIERKKRASKAPEDRLWVYLNDNTGVRVPPDQSYFFESRLRRMILKKGFDDLRALVDTILGQGVEAEALRDEVIDVLMTHETSFFRNPEVYKKLEAELVPELIEAMPEGRAFRAWSAASSTGQEATSLSIMLQEIAPGLPYSILGTDIGVGTIKKASTRTYSVLETNRGLTAKRLHTYFERKGAGFQVKPAIAAPISFRVHNLLEPLEREMPFELVMLRNVLVYFDKPARQQAFENVAAVTQPGAIVVLGTGEQLINIPKDLFERHVADRVAWLRRK